ncbi:hypothetical protein [Planktothrix pseudagardhii]|uniref:2,3-diketo-5-methylthiopentyl-1-phosphate enolase n=1 Tax=Planktothrix pseudagardhii TaxID=132604 RepID=A0A9W4G217_9CYAN|nr:2,3-diketo-5-methylthiopentyl-1-phosphate enolase [Planktothrix pseudagardhii]
MATITQLSRILAQVLFKTPGFCVVPHPTTHRYIIRQAKVIAIGQTAGTWDERFSHQEDNLRSHLAQVINVKTDEQGYNIATVSFPEINVKNDISSLLTMIFGKYSMAGVSKIVAVRLDNNYGQLPKFSCC